MLFIIYFLFLLIILRFTRPFRLLHIAKFTLKRYDKRGQTCSNVDIMNIHNLKIDTDT